MGAPNKHVVFDIVGTCITYEAFFDAIDAHLGDKLRAHCIGSRIFGYAWIEAAEKEYTYLSLTGQYIKAFEVLGAIFYRTLWHAGVENPRTFASDSERDAVLNVYRSALQPREGLLVCFEKLRAAGFTVWALTSGDTTRVAAYLTSGGASVPSHNFVSCDTVGVGKPAPAAYKHILDKFPTEDRDIWFAAAHAWDAAGARECGFKSAWVSAWEKEPCAEIYGNMDVIAADLPGLADAIIAYSDKK